MGATADGAGMLRGGGLFSGGFGFTVLIRQERPAIGIGAAPEKFVGVLPAFLPAQRLAALRAWEGTGLKCGRSGDDGVQKQRKSCVLFPHEVFQRVSPTGYSFKALFPLGRSNRIAERVRGHVDEGLAERRGHKGFAAGCDEPTALEGFKDTRPCRFRPDALIFL